MPRTDWIVYACACMLFVLVTVLTGRVRQALFVATVLTLQANVTLMLTQPINQSWVGNSAPPALLVPLTIVPAGLLLVWQALTGWLSRQRLLWTCGWLTIPMAFYAGTTAVTAVYGPELRPVLLLLQEPAYGFVLCLVAANVIRERSDLTTVLRLLLAVLAIQCGIYFVQNATGVQFTLTGDLVSNQEGGGLNRFGGTVSENPKGFAMFMSVLTLLALATFMGTTDRRLRSWSGVLTAMGAAAIVLTFTRAAWVGFLMGSGLIVVIAMARGRIRLTRVLILAAALVLPVLAFLPLILIRLAGNQTAAAYDERAFLMTIAWRIIEDHPFAGVGAGAYGLVMRDYVLPSEAQGRWLFVVHNGYLARWAETGLLGLASVIWLWVAGFGAALRCTRSRDEATFVLGLGWCAGLLHLGWELLWDVWMGGTTPLLFWFMMGVVQVACAVEARERATTAAVGVMARRAFAYPRPAGGPA